MISSLSAASVNNKRPTAPLPKHGESPSIYADRLGRWYSGWTRPERKKDFGQYLTPIEVARYMATLFQPTGQNLRILDPGAGAGILACALLEELSARVAHPLSIDLQAYESDRELAEHLKSSLAHARSWLGDKKISLNFNVSHDDFVLLHGPGLSQEPSLFKTTEKDEFDLVISNPPYFKIAKSDRRAQVSTAVVHGQPNIYMLFMAISASLLKPGGELTFITPRSFAAGPYFKRFREFFFSLMLPEDIHLFGSRNEAFGKDEVLQENAILHARRVDKRSCRNDGDIVRISHSAGVTDLDKAKKRSVPRCDILDGNSKGSVLRIPVGDRDDEVATIVNRWSDNLHAFGMEISTGPVVPFRARPLIYPSGEVPATHAPLLWMQNVTSMSVEWPKPTRKEQYIVTSDSALPLLVPNKNYVLLRRFSAKEERRRLIAAPFVASSIDSPLLGLENHLNYVYRPKGIVSEEEVWGLAAVLNSDLLDTYFRIFNGNTQVSATEIRRLPLPSLSTIKDIGARILSSSNYMVGFESIVAEVLRGTV